MSYPEEREEIENDKKLPSYSRAIVQDARRSKCISMLNNASNPKVQKIKNNNKKNSITFIVGLVLILWNWPLFVQSIE